MTKVKLTAAQKDEIRRLTQLANRRIKAAEKAYSKAGKDTVPYEIVGRSDLQERSKWATKNTPLSRSVQFESKKDYQEQLKFLRRFDPKSHKAHRPGIKEYTEKQIEKTIMGIETSFGTSVSQGIRERLSKMSAPEVSEFWDRFDSRAKRIAPEYSSSQNMMETFNELYPEDLVSAIA